MIRKTRRNSRMFEYDSQRLRELDKELDVNLALWKALKDCDIDEVKEVLEKGANPNAKNRYGETGLILAAENGCIEAIQTLLDAGADVNAKDNFGYTALIKAINHDYPEIAKLLLGIGTDVNAKNKSGDSALIRAVCRGYIELVELLIANGADVDIRDELGRTALMWACYEDGSNTDHDDKNIAKILLEAGADPNAKDYYGYTALDLAEDGNPEIVELLLDTGVESKKTNKTKSSKYIAEIDRIKGVVHDKNHKIIEGTAFEEKIGVEKTFNSLQELTDGVLDYLGKEFDVSIEENLDYVDTDDGVFIYGFFEPQDNGDVLNYKVRVKVYDDNHHPVSIDDLLDAIGEEEPLGNGIW